jgi:hypothetical protein
MFLMQARSSTTGQLVTWEAENPDWSGASFPGPGLPLDIAEASPQVATTTLPGGDPGQLQVNVGDLTFGGTPDLVVGTGGEADRLIHANAPIHRETGAEFRGGLEAAGYAIPRWGGAVTTDGANTTILDVDVPLALGDCCVTIDYVVTIISTVGRGAMGLRSIRARIGGAWQADPVNERDTGDPTDNTLATAMHTSTPDAHTVRLLGNGIAAMTIRWIASAHIQVAISP